MNPPRWPITKASSGDFILKSFREECRETPFFQKGFLCICVSDNYLLASSIATATGAVILSLWVVTCADRASNARGYRKSPLRIYFQLVPLAFCSCSCGRNVDENFCPRLYDTILLPLCMSMGIIK